MKDLVELYSKKIEGSGLSKSYKKGNSFRFSGVPDSAHSFVACSLYKALPGETVIVVAPDNTIAEFLYRESLSFVDSKDTIYFPGYEAIPYDYARYPPDSKTERIRALSKILSGETFLIFTSVSGLIRKVPHPSTLSGKSLSVKAGEEFPQGDFLKSLSGLGYERSEVCEKFGEFSVKGGIVDVFTSFSEVPIRFDFFGDILEEIKTFDPLTQKSVESLNEAVILPADEFFLTENEKDAYHGKLKEFPESLARPDEELILEELTSLVHKQTGFFSYWKKPPVIVSSSHNAVTDKVLQIEREYESLFAKRSQEIICIPPDELLSRSAEYESLVNKKCVLLTLLPSHEPKESELNLALKETNAFKGKIREVREKILELNSNQGSKMIITASFSQQMERLSGLFQDSEIRIVRAKEDAIQPFEVLKDKISLILALSELRNGFILSEENVTIWSENDIFGRAYKRKTKFKKHASRAIESFIDLKEGDHVVHINHGVGKFLKIEKTSAGGKVRDFLKLEYANGDTLFVPLDQISLVQRYVGGGDRPHLDSLGKNSWKKKKERVQESVDKLAEELILLYSSRMKLQGFAYPPDTIWQDEFEAEFEYEETPDQLAAIEAVKSDLESTRPMDRLVCGDVGYGKTEVAIRASFKVIMAGKQVMMVAPTTILSLQHFNTFQSRFKNYPVKVEMVSRFR
ncbi:MAG: DEAD/DEAH box helicase, partial [Leptospira sp.]|nr:DEAD/DEAH box helicase [Leptospira sp.]